MPKICYRCIQTYFKKINSKEKAEVTGDFIVNSIANKTTKKSLQNKSETSLQWKYQEKIYTSRKFQILKFWNCRR